MHIRFWWFEPYTLKVASGVLVALFWLWRRAPGCGFDRGTLHKWLVILTTIALLSGRLGYVLGNSAYFSQHPADALRLRQAGGLHGSSAIAGGFIIAVLWSRRTHTSLRRVLWLLTPLVMCIAAAAWWGCADVGCAAGREVTPVAGWQRVFVAQMPDLYRMVAPRYAVQSLGAYLALLSVAVAVILRERAGLALSLYLLGSVGLTLLRADSVPLVGRVRVDTVLDLALAMIIGIRMGWQEMRIASIQK